MTEYAPSKNISTTGFFNLFSHTQWQLIAIKSLSIYLYLYLYLSIYIYICVCVYMYIYIYITELITILVNWLIETTLLISLLNLVSKPSKWVPSQFYDGVHLKILPTLSEVILTHLFKACHEDGYDKINELFNTVLSFFNKLRVTANE